MVAINQFELSSIFNSEIVGKARFSHGQLGIPGDVQKYLHLLRVAKAPSERHPSERADMAVVGKAFFDVRNRRNDQGSPDLYIADPVRNDEFIEKCRELGVEESAYIVNKTLLFMRKNNHLKGLHSRKTSIGYEDFAFACEFAATEIRCETTATIDDLLCDPDLATRFDSIARRVAPGYSSFQYRWAILSIRKSGRHAEWKPEYIMPHRQARLRLGYDPLESVPDTLGVYTLFERDSPLYTRATEHLRHGIGIHLRPQTLAGMQSELWQPQPGSLVISYATLPEKKLLRPVEHRLIKEEKPIFNVPRAA